MVKKKSETFSQGLCVFYLGNEYHTNDSAV